MNTTAFIFIVIYLIVDLVYVSLSRSAYEAGAKLVTGGLGFPKIRIPAALLAYGSMAFAWYILVIPRIDQFKGSFTEKIKNAIILAFAYGLAVYGVFNGTLYVMFEKYPVGLVYRDLAWGIGWAIAITCAYAAWTSRRDA